ncbi:glycosyltransferase [Ottowia pentelensis]|uniref:glycosyltransferase n=1 Tax=Ottowia pentelensis TaxID=511108 RepID=UPI0036092BE6
MRIFIGPTEVAGIGHGLTRGLRHLGFEVDGVFESRHPFSYEATQHTSIIARWWCATGGLARNLRSSGSALAWPVAAVHLFLAWPVLALALIRYKAFVFLSGNTITNTRFELFLMRLFGKRCIVLFVGSDARPPYINGAWAWSDVKTMKRLTQKIRRRVRRFESAGIICVNSPGAAHFHRRPIINWFAFGFPSEISDRQVKSGSKQGELSEIKAACLGSKVRLLHSPSNPQVKGTEKIEQIINSLSSRGLPIEWVKISGLSNSQVLDEIRRCDLVVDQLFSDTPMAGLAIEAAQLGKPALVGGYLARAQNLISGNWRMPPSRFVDPEKFEAALEALVVDTEARRSLGDAALNFVESSWSCEAVAGRAISCLKGEIPDEWWFDPSATTYLQGCGLDETEGRRRVRELVDAYGKNALGLDDKPSLTGAFLDWAGRREPTAANVQATRA